MLKASKRVLLSNCISAAALSSSESGSIRGGALIRNLCAAVALSEEAVGCARKLAQRTTEDLISNRSFGKL